MQDQHICFDPGGELAWSQKDTMNVYNKQSTRSLEEGLYDFLSKQEMLVAVYDARSLAYKSK